jgi:hypothetical protein
VRAERGASKECDVSSGLKNSSHLIALVAACLVGVAIFAVVRASVVPEGFGKYGHYRPGALDDNMKKPISYAGKPVCAGCHYDIDEKLTSGKHQSISCETCHGAQAKHAGDPASGKPPLPKVEGLCVRCHEADAAKPKRFPQVASVKHSGGVSCDGCHQPHKPKI